MYGTNIKLRHAHLGTFCLEPEDIKSQSLGSSGASARRQGSREWGYGAQGAYFIYRPKCIGDEEPRTLLPINLSICLSVCMSVYLLSIYVANIKLNSNLVTILLRPYFEIDVCCLNKLKNFEV
jgi:hypothetical protein